MKATVDITALNTKLSNISKLNIKQALTNAAYLVENDAKMRCPVDTGALRNSITHQVYEDKAEIGTNFSYAPYIEFGTGLFAVAGDGRKTPWSYQDSNGDWHTTTGMKPQPFLEPALSNNVKAIETIIKNAIKAELDKESK